MKTTARFLLYTLTVLLSVTTTTFALPTEVASSSELLPLQPQNTTIGPVDVVPRNWEWINNECSWNENDIINETSASSPLIADCRQILINISKGGTWSYSTAQRHRKIVSYRTCALGIERDGGESRAETAKVGNTDIEDMIKGLAKLAEQRRDIKMGGKAPMKCMNLVQMRRVKIWFAVYHN